MINCLRLCLGSIVVIATTNLPQGCTVETFRDATITQLSQALSTIISNVATTVIYNLFDLPNALSF